MKTILPICLIVLTILACSGPEPIPVHPISYKDIMIIPSGSMIVFPEEHSVDIGQLGAITSITIQEEHILFSKMYLHKILKLKLGSFEE